MQFKWLQIFCLCAAIQFQLIEGNPTRSSTTIDASPRPSSYGSETHYNGNHQNRNPAQGAQLPVPQGTETVISNNGNQHSSPQGENSDEPSSDGLQPGIDNTETSGNQSHADGTNAHIENTRFSTTIDASPGPSSHGSQTRNHNNGNHRNHDETITYHEITDTTIQGQNYGSLTRTTPSSIRSHADGTNAHIENTRVSTTIDASPGPSSHGSQTRNHNNGNHRNRSQPKNHICTKTTEHYDCQIRDVHLKKGERMDFGLQHHNPERNLTFVDSTLEYLPKSLIDAFRDVILLNLNDLKIASIEQDAFERAAKLQTVYLEGNRLIRIDRDAFRGANNLQILVLSNNEITHIDNQAFDSNTGLQSLNLDRNRLEELPSFEKAAGLQFLNASHNNLVSIDDGHFRQLRYLQIIDLSFNRLERLNLQQLNANFELVDVSCNDLIDFVMPKYVKILYARNNSITQFEVGQQCQLRENCKSLEYLDLSYNLLETFVYKKSMDKLQTINLAHNNLFEIQIPIKTAIPSFKKLDLSHNKLTHISSLDAFKNLEWLLLNNNKLITFNKTIKSFPNAIQMAMANNEWNCDDIKYFESKTMDKHNNHCATGQENRNGICCRAYSKPYNDRLNEVLREAYLHERENQKKCSKPVSALSNQNTYLDEIRNAMANADTEKRNKLEEIKKVKLKQNKLEASVKEFQEKQDRLANSKVNVAREIERQRQSHRVTKEGLISDKEMLERIIKFVTERDAFNKDLLSRRQNDTEESNNLHGEKQREFDELNRTIEKLKKHITSLKQEEKNQKRVKDLLEKKVNKNSASIHGSSGTISQ